MPTSQEYREILSGKSQVLSSKFKISYNLILEQKSNTILEYSKSSMITDEIEKEINYYHIETNNLETKINEQTKQLKNLLTPINILEKYHILIQHTNLQK